MIIIPSLTPTGKTAIKLQELHDAMFRDKQRRVMWNEVLDKFFDDFHDVKVANLDLKIQICALKQQIRELGGKVEQKEDVIEQTLLNLSKQSAPMMMQSAPIMTQNTLVAPPAAPLLPPPAPISNKAPSFVKELNGHFVDGKLKPSEIGMQFNEPRYLENE